MPFSRVFISDDIIHRKLVPKLLTEDQVFFTGKEIKEDLKKIKQIKTSLSTEELKRANSEPPRNKQLIIYKIWQQMYFGWPPEVDWTPSEEEYEMMQKAVSEFRNAKKIE